MSPVEALLSRTKYPVYICSLPNDHGAGKERHLFTRKIADAQLFAKQCDKKGRGVFFCTSTMRGPKRNKDNAAEAAFLHVDIDFKNYDLRTFEILRTLEKMSFPPTVIVHSGNGLHAYWMLIDPVVPDDEFEETLRRLSQLFDGDRAVLHRAALLRMPGTHNTKGGKWTEVKMKSVGPSYSLDRLRKLIAKTEPLLESRTHALDVFAAYGKQFHAPIDIATRLADMEFQGEGDRAIHITQRSVIASMASRDWNEDEAVAEVLKHTKLAAGKRRWNWQLEERKLRRMYRTWVRKI